MNKNRVGTETKRLREDSIDNDENKVIMKCNPYFLTFDKQTYPQILEEKGITKGEWETIALEATKVAGEAWINKQNYEKISIPKWMEFMGTIILIFSFLFFIMFYVFAESENTIFIIFVSGIIFIVLALLGILFLIIYNFLRKIGKNKYLITFILESMEGYLDQLNIRYARKIRFKLKHNIDKKVLEIFENRMFCRDLVNNKNDLINTIVIQLEGTFLY